MTKLARAAVVLVALAVGSSAPGAAAQQSAFQALLDYARVSAPESAPDSASKPPEGVLILPPTPAETLSVKLWFLPEDAAELDAPPRTGEERLVITGAYSSGDRFAPEGFVIRDGDATHPYPQGWDGLLLVAADGRASIHDVTDVRAGGRRYDLRDRAARTKFLERAAADGMSAIQSHLLINDGRLDVKPSPSARRFRRRLLFETRDGALGVFDTSPTAMTLYEAAEALRDTLDPRMALNLDMGTYDFCERVGEGAPENCGLLARGEIQKLTNLIAITRRAD